MQASVVFDRAMVPLTGLEDMNAAVPLSCTPGNSLSGRWAGSSTAIVTHDSGAFPFATRFTCSVPAGTAGIDGVELERELSWTFETARPRMNSSQPRHRSSEWDPKAPMRLSFDQPVLPESVADHVSLYTDGLQLLALSLIHI